MKAKVSYIASKVPSFLTESLPIVVKRESAGTGGTFKNWTELTDWVEANGTASDVDTFMAITCQCGQVYPYTTKNDVPKSNTACSCGRLMIQYG